MIREVTIGRWEAFSLLRVEKLFFIAKFVTLVKIDAKAKKRLQTYVWY